ncbi:glutamine synthetase [bacterium]|nr:glutamine synthetase [bacterium]
MNGKLSLDDLKRLIEKGEIDTILPVFPDHYGRLLGKRLTAEYFLSGVEKGMLHNCNYLLTVDMDMNPIPGFAMASWDKGYGDFVSVMDMGTLRRIPWLPRTALVVCDLHWENGEPVAQAPRSILREQCRRLHEAGLYANMGSELEFYLFKESVSAVHERDYKNLHPSSDYRIDYHILHTSLDEPIIRAIRNGMSEAGVPIECSKGEWGAGQHEIGLWYSEALEMADRHVIYKNGVKEIAALAGASATFMAKYDAAQAGSGFHIHTSLVHTKSGRNAFWDEKSHRPTPLFRQFLGGMLALSREFCLLFTPSLNAYKRYTEDSFAPTRIAWAHDNRTTGYRIVGEGQSFRIENRMPGADGNPYLAFAATLAAGLYGIEHQLDCGEPYEGNAYTATDLPKLPATLKEATELFDKSEAARKLFGDDVVEHYVHAARTEQAAFERAVTDWELRQYFDRI